MDIAHKIYSTYQNDSQKRTHLGASYIGHECNRYIYYTWKNIAPVSDGRILKIFETGNIQEDVLINRLKLSGLDIYHEQLKLKDKELDILGGSIDGIIDYNNLEYILEIKTFNDARFKELKNKGVKNSNYIHYCQMVMYMGWSEIPRALYIAINKNSEEIYSEVVESDILLFYALRDKAKKIIEINETPKRISETKTFFKCKMCNFYNICFK